MSLPVLSRAACASMSTTTTTTRDRGDRYGPIEWAQQAQTDGRTDAADCFTFPTKMVGKKRAQLHVRNTDTRRERRWISLMKLVLASIA